MLIKRHISERQLKRPEGEEAVRAHLYVDERESVDRPCIRIQKGEIISICTKICRTREGEKGRDRAGERERGREGERWQWDGVGG